ncbi:hypothetical protein EJ02DRAFT_154364 [Clathrospora elynae]|uniref:Uncharacterized protein n=1 Tax=Clathrospora elynae TaxID=706981 RepID=A0A6A5STF7_9PLEO|nr:hypothetical protein EJ02DRAFT_154364 [Clathrospora elynae]
MASYFRYRYSNDFPCAIQVRDFRLLVQMNAACRQTLVLISGATSVGLLCTRDGGAWAANIQLLVDRRPNRPLLRVDAIAHRQIIERPGCICIVSFSVRCSWQAWLKAGFLPSTSRNAFRYPRCRKMLSILFMLIIITTAAMVQQVLLLLWRPDCASTRSCVPAAAAGAGVGKLISAELRPTWARKHKEISNSLFPELTSELSLSRNSRAPLANMLARAYYAGIRGLDSCHPKSSRLITSTS